jgi:hypothetical protein
MTVFVAHAPADRETAEALEKFIERRGHFVELDDGQTALRPVQASDVVVLLISKDFVFAPTRLRLEQRALDAWTENRLLAVKLDHGIAPVGLRDLPTIDASVAARREFKWQEIADSVRAKLNAPRPESDDAAPAPERPQILAKPNDGGPGLLTALLMLLLALPGAVALAATAAIYLVNRIGPRPGGLPELIAGIDAFGVRYGLPHGVTLWIFPAAIAVTLGVLSRLIWGMFARPRIERQTLPPPGPATETQPEANDSVFVSYARANAKQVMPVIEAAQHDGRYFWLDQQSMKAGESWAGEIVRAIRGAGEVVVMCSKAAFESDHVKREIYLADRYRKRLMPVFIEDAQAPEDFEYFFAGVQQLKLFETPEADRPRAFADALGDTP